VFWWHLIRWLHLISMAFFVGGQLMLAAVVVPVVRGTGDRKTIRRVARGFGIGSGVAILVLLITGSLMASHFNRWSDHDLQIKLGLVAVVALLIGWHTRKPEWHALEGIVFVLSLAIVWLGIAVAH
jgi:branched-subunit amino acid transport protein